MSDEKPVAIIACSRGSRPKVTMPDGVTKADLGTCRGCGEEICWVRNPQTGKALNRDGKSHFSTCDKRLDFARKAEVDADENRSPRLL